MPHFVTSAQGKAHVTSANAAHLTAGLLGNGCYVLPIGQKLACTMTDSNTLRVLFGVASVCGRQWEIEGDYEEVNIENGVPGYNRTDLLVCRIETAPQETIELKVYKGDETTGTPVVPGHVEGDLNDGDTVCEMPICSVRVNGINPQAPEMLAKESIDIMALLQELRDYKSQAINGSKLVDKSVGTVKLADGSVTSEKIKDGTIAAADLTSTLKNRIESAPCVYRDLNASGSVNANTAKEFAVSPPAVTGYTCVGIVSVTVNNPRCYLSKFTTSGITVLNANSSAVSPTVYYRLLYVKS